MTLWFLLALVFIVQEPISASAVLLEAYQSHYNLWLIHLLFTAMTLVDIVVTYYLGDFIRKRFAGRKFIAALKKRLDDFSSFIGEKGKVVALVFYAPLLFPLSGLFISWLDIPLWDAVIWLLIGEWIFWYGYEWLLVLGVKSFATNSYEAVVAILIVSAIVALATRYFMRRRKK